MPTTKTALPRKSKATAHATVAAQFKTLIPNFDELNITVQQAQFALEYSTNGFDSGAAYQTVFDKRVGIILANQRANILLAKDGIRQAVVAVVSYWINEKKVRLEKEILTTLYAQAFYDPSMFIEIDGSPAFSSWEDIPKEYRCCVEGIETKMSANGLNSRIVLKLVDRKWALDKLMKLISMATAPSGEELNSLSAAQKSVNNVQNNFLISQDASSRLASIFSQAFPEAEVVQ